MKLDTARILRSELTPVGSVNDLPSVLREKLQAYGSLADTCLVLSNGAFSTLIGTEWLLREFHLEANREAVISGVLGHGLQVYWITDAYTPPNMREGIPNLDNSVLYAAKVLWLTDVESENG